MLNLFLEGELLDKLEIIYARRFGKTAIEIDVDYNKPLSEVYCILTTRFPHGERVI